MQKIDTLTCKVYYQIEKIIHDKDKGLFIVNPSHFFNNRLAVRLGTTERYNATIQIPVIYKISHQDYEPKPKYFNDIGLLKLDSYALKEDYTNSLDGM